MFFFAHVPISAVADGPTAVPFERAPRPFWPSLRIPGIIRDFARGVALLWVVVGFATPLAVRRLLRLRLDRSRIGSELATLLESRGLVYRKLGQYLALRMDLLGPEICRELDTLFDATKPMPFEQVTAIIEREFGAPASSLFLSFEHEPVGSASVAQVHRAVLLDGTTLAVKIRREGILDDFFAESRNLLRFASVCDFFHLAGRTSLHELVSEFLAYTKRELDFRIEGDTAERLRHDCDATRMVPRIRWDLTTSSVLAMEYIEGVSLLKLCRLAEVGEVSEITRLVPGVNLDRLIDGLANACFHQLFETGFFHGDPNPANILVRSDGSFAFIDYGIFGELSVDDRRDLRNYIFCLAEGRFSEAAEQYAHLCVPSAWTNIVEWKRDLTTVLAAWYSTLTSKEASFESRHMAPWQASIVKTLTRHHVQMRPNLLLVWRAMVVLDTTALRLSKHFDLQRALFNYFASAQPKIMDLLLGHSRGTVSTSCRKDRNVLPLFSSALAAISNRRAVAFPARIVRSPASWRNSMAMAMAVGAMTLASGLAAFRRPPSFYQAGIAGFVFAVVAAASRTRKPND